ncbi:elongation factor 1-delta isoform X3 [Dendrobates tinctorius]|uniref:elongation factor 1-delta isoform X3 n=1 Tax=Dendrobates tinctorius TaxID=92724 RepID=UPI003CCA0D01
MRTRKHQSLAESSWVDKLKCEDGAKLVGETQTTPNPEKNEETNGTQSEPLGNSLTTDQKKVNGKKQKKRRRSPRNKVSPLKAEAALLGMMADTVWLDKYVYDDAECSYHTRLATEQNLPPSAKVAAIIKHKNSVTGGCCHASTVACHHVSKGIWVNKFNFEDAESHFVMRFSSPLAPRVLNLNLVSPDRTAPTTPDEGYASATPTPAAMHNPLTVNAIVSDRTVNGKPHWAGLQSLLSEVWLDKSLYDQAETRYYEHVAQAKPNPNTWSHHTGKRAKKDKWSRKSAGKQRKELASIPEEATANTLYYPTYYLHTDSERVWLDKASYDQAEVDFYSTRSHRTTDAMKYYKLSSVAKRPRAVKSRHSGKKDMAASFLSTDKIWFDKYKYDDAEKQYYEQLTQKSRPDCQNQTQLRTVLHSPKEGQAPPSPSQTGSHTSAAAPNSGESCELLSRVASLEHENQNLHKVVRDLQSVISKLESRISTLEKSAASKASAPLPPAVCKLPAPKPAPAHPPAAAPKPKAEEEDDDDIDLFGSDDEEEDAEAARIREERLQQYAEKKSKKPGLIAKSSILLDVKPWDDETDMAKLEECVRSVQMDGLLWGSSKLVPVGYGIKKLQIQCVVEDDKVGTDMLEEEITMFEDYVQSVDIAAFNKI